MAIAEKVKNLVESKIVESGYLLSDVLYVKEDGINFLRIMIDLEQGITVEDCVTVCKLINPIIDKIDFIDEAYILDVCSKGSEQ